ncbi:cinnamoyl-CoA reductase 1-like [Zingiber officinale]|uniref:cinnamoyl-CoA reductase 1-like n=1 Tax=Zingiber officinale TaxID=94328 RepID=UPI001C4D0B5B|nr:cinnamoyl-CoA reductase 1-like [Zingiber officinale]
MVVIALLLAKAIVSVEYFRLDGCLEDKSVVNESVGGCCCLCRLLGGGGGGGGGDEVETAHLRSLPSASNRLRLFQIDLLDPDSILAAIHDVSGVFHLASPCIITRVQDPQRELLDPTVTGTLNVLRAAKESGVRRVVVTSLISTIVPRPGWPADRVKDESCWTDLDYCQQKEHLPRQNFPPVDEILVQQQKLFEL